MHPMTTLLPLMTLSAALRFPPFVENMTRLVNKTTSAHHFTNERGCSTHMTAIHGSTPAPSTTINTVDISVTNSLTTETIHATVTFAKRTGTDVPIKTEGTFQGGGHRSEVDSKAGDLEQGYYKPAIHPRSKAHPQYPNRSTDPGRREELRAQNKTEHCGDLECDTPNAGFIIVHSAASSFRDPRLFSFGTVFSSLARRVVAVHGRKRDEVRALNVTKHCGDLECDTPNAGFIIVHNAASSLRVPRLFSLTSTTIGSLAKRAAAFDVRRKWELRIRNSSNETFPVRVPCVHLIEGRDA